MKPTEYMTPKAEVFSLGMSILVAAELGKKPGPVSWYTYKYNSQALSNSIKKLSGFSQEFLDMLSLCLELDEEKRLSPKELIEMDFFKAAD